MTNNNVKKLIVSMLVGVFITVLGTATVYADNKDCEPRYGGGETCVINKSFEIIKKVRVKDEDSKWKDKVTDVAEDDEVEFLITIKNRTSGNLTVDDMKMIDKLPSEMERIGGDGLTEYFDNFAPGDTEEFIIRARVKKSEFDRKNDFDKCVVNRAEVRYKNNFEGSDTATVCYGEDKDDKSKPNELPKTGGSAVTASLLGLGLVSLGTLIKKGKKA